MKSRFGNVSHRAFACSYVFLAVLPACALLPASFSAHCEGIRVFDVNREPDKAAAILENFGDVRTVEKGGEKALQIAPDTDPYSKVEWRFRFREPLAANWTSLVLELEFFDEGAGVIQPVILSNDAFNGEWSPPVRAVSFTRLNTMKVRRSLFEFSIPRTDWRASSHAHLKIAGLQYLKSIHVSQRVPDAEWRTLEHSVPVNVTPMVRLNRPMSINCTVGIPDIGYPPSIETALSNISEYAPLAKVLGFTSVECFVRWDLLEPSPGQFDFSHYDRIVRSIQRYGLKWYPNLVITSALALPSWYFENVENTGMKCLEHNLTNQVPSIWNPANQPHVARVLKAFGDHYGPMGVLEAVRLGPSGNFGEAQFPAGAGSALGYRGGKMHAHIGWWAGDPFAKTDFQTFLRGRYATVDALNKGWDVNHASFEEIVPQLPETCRTRRGRLDFTEWYTDSMTHWCEFWAKAARDALPATPIYQSSGGWGFREAGTDFTAQSESMQKYGGGIRLTNETDSFEQNFYATRLAATAARLYGIPLGYEPAGYHSARGVVGRFFSTATTNGTNLYTRHSVLFTHPYAVDNWLREFPILDMRAPPLIDVAVYYPETMNQLDDAAFRHLYAWGFNPRAAEVRRRIDVDFLDERLIRHGFLDRYRVLVFCWGNVVETDVQQIMDRWIHAGGTAIYPTYPRGPQENTAEDKSIFLAWEKGDTGKGSFHRFQGDMEPLTLYGDYVEKVLRQTPGLHPWTQAALAVRHPQQVFLSVLENGAMVALNYAETPATIELEGRFSETLPAFSTRVMKLD